MNQHAARRRWMAVLARAEAAELAALLDRHAVVPLYTRLRGPEAGLVMVRGRTGGGGAPFNLGEMTVTRCTCADRSRGRWGTPTSPGAMHDRRSWRRCWMRCCKTRRAPLHCRRR